MGKATFSGYTICITDRLSLTKGYIKPLVFGKPKDFIEIIYSANSKCMSRVNKEVLFPIHLRLFQCNVNTWVH